MKKIYLAGPDVFLPNAKEVGEQLKRICSEFGFLGLFPLDNEIEEESSIELAKKIREANISMIESCDGMIANLSPFRGPEPDSGTVWEMGYATALQKIAVGYSIDRRTLKERTVAMLQLDTQSTKDSMGMQIEDFGLSHNLMFAQNVQCGSFEEAIKKIAELM